MIKGSIHQIEYDPEILNNTEIGCACIQLSRSFLEKIFNSEYFSYLEESYNAYTQSINKSQFLKHIKKLDNSQKFKDLMAVMNQQFIQSTTQVQKQLNNIQIMNVLSIGKYVFTVIEDDHLYFVNSEFKILGVKNIQCPLYSGVKHYVQDIGLEMSFPLMQQLVISNGTIYLQVYESVFALKVLPLELEFMARIPIEDQNCINLSFVYNRLYNHQNLLFVNNNLNSSYPIDCKKKECGVRVEGAPRSIMVQFCDLTFALSSRGIEQVMSDQSLKFVHELQAQQLLLTTGGFIVAKRTNDVQIIHLLTMREKITTDKRFSDELFSQQLELGPMGLQLKSEIIRELFVPDVLTPTLNYHQQFVQEQNKLGYQDVVSGLLMNQVQARFEHENELLKQVKLNLQEKKNTLQYEILANANLTNHIAAGFNSLFYEYTEETQ
ncbi:Conserved_hypothetical protein [Hexamita inflata]|uniref:Uncharacterized protein n=1 Tax=Hexamita inflata TaxID=28002 RepID=A0AA86R4N3_9EUKA|nr:Conserved hypothetical protein [Hexamita inflata]